MSKRKKHDEEHENAERWLLTYADLITLLMAFFCILFAMASVDAVKFKVLAQSMSMAFGSSKGGGENMLSNFQGAAKPAASADMAIIKENADFKMMVKMISEYAAKNGLEKSVKTSITERGLVINLAEPVLYESGQAVLTLQSQKTLDYLAEIIFKGNYATRVEGHTDNIPIRTAKYQSNWQLSTDRSTNVIMYWLATRPEMAPKLSAAGYGEFRPKASNATYEGRAQNRRVEIVVLREGVAQKEY